MARIKYFNSVTGQWEYADSQYSTGSGGNVDLTGVVKSVNGVTPDENGNVEITIPDTGGNIGYPNWSHLKWYVMGDSLTAQDNNFTSKHYYDFVQEKTGIRLIVDGIGGTGYKNGEDRGESFLDRIKNLPEDVDIVSIFGSGNDLSSANLQYADKAIWDTLKWLMENRPGLPVIVVPPSPWKSTDTHNYTKWETLWKSYCDRLQLCAFKCNHRYMSDMYDCPPFYPDFEKHMEKFFTTDPNGIHPNEAGHEALATYFYNALAQELEFDASSGINGSGGNADQSGVYYIATDHGVRPDVEDNTAAMQKLIDTVHDHGGGIIWLPIGEYRFDSANSVPENSDFRTILTPKSGVSIIGESLSGTVIQVYGHTEKGASWLANYIADRDDKSVKLSGCTYRNFTIDMSEATVAEYSSTGKALGMKALRDCIFRDLRLLNTPSTALGIDMLDNVVIDSVYVYRGGREWQPGGQGGAGIGIGTGKWENENYVVRNCLCVECGHFGIFLEDQGIFSSNQQNYPEGLTITNNVVRNGRNYGIGVRGGRNVIITGNNLYGNKGGIYLDYGAKNVLASNNVIADCTEAGLLFGIEDAGFGNYPCENVAVLCNSFFDNKLGISTALRMPINSEFTSNIFIGNDSNMTVEIPIEESRIKQGVYINDAGEEAANDRSWLYDEFIDLDTTMITWTPIGKAADGTYKNPRIAIYDENKGFLHRINGDYQPDKLKTIIEEALTAAGESTNFRYIKFGDNCRGEILTTLQLYSLK